LIRRARISDVRDVQKLVNGFARKHKLIQRSLNDLYDNIRDIFVYEAGGKIKGTLSLHVSWEDLAEIRSLAVIKASQNRGIGKALIKAALRDAAELGVKRVFSLTYIPGYFHTLGFRDIDKAELPSKIWTDCLNCPHFPECDEEAVITEIKGRKRR
jgi:amino-acid N-acetyltransferase